MKRKNININDVIKMDIGVRNLAQGAAPDDGKWHRITAIIYVKKEDSEIKIDEPSVWIDMTVQKYHKVLKFNEGSYKK